MNTIDDDNVLKRLRSPPVRETKSVTGLVAKYVLEIEEARRSGKTWAMIGRDLQPDNPIKADTVRRTVERATKRRARKVRSVRQRNLASRPTPAAAQPQLELQAPETPNNPFGRKVDPIRNDQ